jgi:nitronate monooxygenase
MKLARSLLSRLGIVHPIIQAPMAGGGDTPDLVASVCNAGGLGCIGAAYLTPEQIVETGRGVRAKTAKPFGINLFAPIPPVGDNIAMEPALRRLAPYYSELGITPPTQSVAPRFVFAEQLVATLQTEASVFSFTFGIPPSEAISAIKQRGIFLLGTATTVDEATELERTGVDAIVAQGSEAGGHRGSFSGDFEAGMVGTISLVPQIVDAVRVPVIASGGIMDGRGIAAALALGASAVQLGTAFLTCEEAGISNAYKDAILQAHENQTRITRAFSGRFARGIVNRFMNEMESAGSRETILPFPVQNDLTRALRAAASKQGRAEFLSLWAGQGLRMARRQSAADLVERLAGELKAAIRSMQGFAEDTRQEPVKE